MLENSTPAIEVSTTAEATPVVDTAVSTSAPEVQPQTSWLDSLPEEYKVAKPLQNFKGPEDLAKSYLHASQLLGKKVDEWAAEDISKLYSKLGRPESSDKYILPQEVGDSGKDIADLGFKLGLNQTQMNDLVNELVMKDRAKAESAKAEADAKANEWVSDIKKEFGAAFDERVKLAQKAVSEFGGDELKAVLNETGLGNHPALVKLFARIGKEFLEEGRIVKGDQAAIFGTTPSEAKKQIDMKMLDKDFRDAYFRATHPAHAAAVAEMARLHELAAHK